MNVLTSRRFAAATTLAALGLALSGGCGNKPGQVPATPVLTPKGPLGAEHHQPDEVRPQPQTGPVVTLTPEQYYKELKKDKKAMLARYKGAIIEMTGVIQRISPRAFGDASPDYANRRAALVELKMSEEGWPFDTIGCVTVDPEPWKLVSVGQSVKIRGQFPTFETDPALFKCRFVGLKALPTSVVSTEQLAGEYAADAKATTEKYKKKMLIVFGEIVEKTANEAGAPTLFLKGKDRVGVRSDFSGFDHHKLMIAPLKVGEQVTLLGWVASSDDSLALNFERSEVIKKP